MARSWSIISFRKFFNAFWAFSSRSNLTIWWPIISYWFDEFGQKVPYKSAPQMMATKMHKNIVER
jgi:hypothetical protein